ncbi:MAG: class I SAM-dependent methyltransferase [Bacteroidetes bacterium]|nr:class I SAM-dependent methyltransferase [Bacteroidota bacterium]
MNEWYKEWFDSEDYLLVYNHRDDQDAIKLTDLILRETGLPEGSSILDAACGAGRHCRLFAQKGYKVEGFDLSKNLLSIAHKRAKEEKLEIKFRIGDIRSIIYETEFDLVTNLFTSFGYFDTDAENFSFVKNAFKFIKVGGYYAIDFLNKKYLEENLVSKSENLMGSFPIIEERVIENGRVNKIITLKKPGIDRKYTESVKLYTFEELLEKFNEIGFKFTKAFGNYDGEEFNINISPRAIIIFRK